MSYSYVCNNYKYLVPSQLLYKPCFSYCMSKHVSNMAFTFPAARMVGVAIPTIINANT